MKKIIHGKLYNLATAKEIAYVTNDDYGLAYWAETLYQKRTGEFFLYGEGGPMSCYARAVGQNQWTGGEEIIPLTEAEAKEWAERHLDADDYIDIFGEVEE